MTDHLFTRRAWLGAVAATLPSLAFAQRGIGVVPFDARVDAIEQRVGGRLGVAFLDTGSGRRGSHRGDERFPLCSTFKLSAVAAVLARVDARQERLDRPVPIRKEQILSYAPVTSKHAGESMPLEAICAAAIEVSDNTAGNLLLDIVGGPSGLTAWLRKTGDPVTRLDRTEPTLNSAEPRDVRDTTSPVAMLETMHRLLVGATVLSEASRKRLLGWMEACSTGQARLRAGLPAGWRIGDKTGTGAHGASNDIAIAWPPGRPPILMTVYFVGSPAAPRARDAAIASVGTLIARTREDS